MVLAAMNVLVNVVMFAFLSKADVAPEMGWALVLLIAALNAVGLSDMMDAFEHAPRRRE